MTWLTDWSIEALQGIFTRFFTRVKINLKMLIYTLKNQRLKITQLEKARFIKVNELKLTQVELF